jgi:hypothetical protein
MMLRILADRRRSLGEDHIRMVCQLYQLLLELISDVRSAVTGPGGHAGRLPTPARSACTLASALRRSHFPDPLLATYATTISSPFPVFFPRAGAAAAKRPLLDGGEHRRTLTSREQPFS